MEVIRCSDCTDAVAQQCGANFQDARVVLDGSVEATMSGGWTEVIVDEGGRVKLQPAGLELTMQGNAFFREVILGGLRELQQGIGCTLDADEIEAKLTTT